MDIVPFSINKSNLVVVWNLEVLTREVSVSYCPTRPLMRRDSSYKRLAYSERAQEERRMNLQALPNFLQQITSFQEHF